MALRMMESFDTYATAQLLSGRWTDIGATGAGSVAVQAAQGRRSTAALVLTMSQGGAIYNVRKVLDAQPTWIVGCAVRPNALNARRDILAWHDGGTTQVDLVLELDGRISATRNGTTLGMTGPGLSAGVYTYIEWRVTIHPSAGQVQVTLNGQLSLDLSGVNTSNTGSSAANVLVLGSSRLGAPAIANVQLAFDDLYLLDGTGAAPYNARLGDSRVDALRAIADAPTLEWTPSTGTAHWSLIDEIPPQTTDYVEAATVGQTDLYAFEEPPPLANPTIWAVGVNLYAQNPEAGLRQPAARVLSGASGATGAGLPMSNSWTYWQSVFTTNPNGAVAWTPATVRDARYGVTVLA